MTSTHFRQRLNGWLLRLPAPLRWWKLAHLPQTTLATMRQDYGRGVLSECDLDPDPVRQFERWLGDALAAKLPEPHAMTLATTDSDGRPGARTVLLKAFDARGFVFFTNYESRKGRQLAACPHAALLFTWLPLERQIEICGPVEKVSAEESSTYFDSRPLASRVGAWASPQSRVIRDRAELEAQVTAAIERFRREPLTVPPFWGGYRLAPMSFEFWQGRPGRLHDRLRYIRSADDAWTVERLAP